MTTLTIDEKKPHHDVRPLRREEYFGMKMLMAIFGSSERAQEALRGRLKTCGRFSREMTRLHRSSLKILDALLYTIPEEQLSILQREFQATEFYIRTGQVSVHDNDAQDYVSVTRNDLTKLISYVMRSECGMCAKTGKAARRCPASRLLSSVCTWETPKVMPSGDCFWNLYQFDASDDPFERIKDCTEECYGID